MQTPRSTPSPSNPVVAALQRRHGPGARIDFATFVEAALYASEGGYYRTTRERVGSRADTDFYTAESLGPVFRELVLEAAVRLLGGRAPEAFRFVELGAEPGGGLLGDPPHPFGEATTIRPGDSLDPLRGPCVVFSNELFDAQPFRRYTVVGGRWHELGVELGAAGPTLCDLGPGEPPGSPPAPREGYLLDDPCGARALAGRILEAPWQGLFLAFDYGLDRATLLSDRPAGTARTYRQHRLEDDLLADPGHYDLTHHICWDDLRELLATAGADRIELQRQEAFFMHHAPATIARVVALGARPGVHPALQTLKELLHPENMGRKFQVLHAFRGENACQGTDRP